MFGIVRFVKRVELLEIVLRRMVLISEAPHLIINASTSIIVTIVSTSLKICTRTSIIVLNHVLAKFRKEVILIKDGAPIYKGYTKAVHIVLGIFGIKWPAFSPDLNAIKKV